MVNRTNRQQKDDPLKPSGRGPGYNNPPNMNPGPAATSVTDPVVPPATTPASTPATTPATTPTQGGKREQREQEREQEREQREREREQRRQEGQTAPPAQTPLSASPTYTDPNKVSPLVSEQITGILSQASPYMQQARTRGEQYANTRGLLNSSLGGQASQQAVIEAALPIAQQDAQFASGMEQERLASELTFERENALQTDRLTVSIMDSDMTDTQKDAAIAYLQSGNVQSGGSTNPVDLTPDIPAEEAIGTDWQKIQQEHQTWKNFVHGEKAQAYLQENALPKTPIQVTSRLGNPIKGEFVASYPNVLKELYGDRKYGYSKEEIERANRFGEPVHGNWQNINFLLSRWLGPGDVSDDKVRWALAKDMAGE